VLTKTLGTIHASRILPPNSASFDWFPALFFNICIRSHLLPRTGNIESCLTAKCLFQRDIDTEGRGPQSIYPTINGTGTMDALESSGPLTSTRIARLAFETANRRLQKVLSKKVEGRLKSVNFPDFSSIINVESTAAELEAALGKLIESQDRQKDSSGRVETIKRIIGEWFRVSYPFARVFLSIAVTGAQVCLASIFFSNLRYLC
jgi:hypothetical protein